MNLSRHSSPITSRKVWSVSVVVVLLASVAIAGAFNADAGDEAVVDVGRWRPTVLPPGQEPDGYGAGRVEVLPEPATRRLYAHGDDTWLAAYDLDTLRPLGAGLLVAPGARKTAFLADPSGSLFVAYLGGSREVWLDEFTVREGAVVRVSRTDLTPSLPGKQVIGITRAPGTNAMWVLADVQLAGTLAVAELRLSPTAGQPAAVAWVDPIDECTAAVHGNPSVPAAVGYVAMSNALFFGCGNQPVTEYSPPHLRGVARLSLAGSVSSGTQPGPTLVFARAGDFARGDSVFDPASGRLTLTANSSAGGAGTSVYVFDTASERYVGGIAAGKNLLSAVGFHPVGGRLYGLSPNPQIGLVLGEVRLSPPGQGTTVPRLARNNGVVPIASTYIAVDPVTSRLFLRYTGTEDFVIVQDRFPFAAAPRGGDPDAQTSDVEEVAGLTQRNVSGSAQGFGARYRQIGGTQAVVLNYAGFDGLPTPLSPGSREFRAAYLHRLTLGNQETTAAAIAADRDTASTQNDLDKTQPKDQEGDPVTPPGRGEPIGPLANWPYAPARCADFGEKSDAQTVQGATVACDTAKRTVTAGGDLGSVQAGVGVQRSTVSAKAMVDAKRGTVTSVTSSAHGIDILGVVRIGEATSLAEAVARGRRGSASTAYASVVKDVVMDGRVLCQGSCDLNDIAAQINQRLVGRARVTFGDAQREATPGGYQALVKRAPLDHIEQIVLNEQPADRVEVPALTVTLIQDAAKPQRTVVELAAVQAEARYGISLIGGGGDGDDQDGDGSLLDGLLPGEGGPGSPFFGLPPGTGGGGSGAPGTELVGATGDGPLSAAGRLIWNGLRALKLLPVWAVLLAPIYLSARRWLLLQRSELVPGGRQ